MVPILSGIARASRQLIGVGASGQRATRLLTSKAVHPHWDGLLADVVVAVRQTTDRHHVNVSTEQRLDPSRRSIKSNNELPGSNSTKSRSRCQRDRHCALRNPKSDISSEPALENGTSAAMPAAATGIAYNVHGRMGEPIHAASNCVESAITSPRNAAMNAASNSTPPRRKIR